MPPSPTQLDTPCREWPLGRNGSGYGFITRDGRQQRVHRWIVAQIDGWDAIEGKMVLHRCDNPPCFRYDHLFVGTQKDNMADASHKGRAKGGRKPGTPFKRNDMHINYAEAR